MKTHKGNFLSYWTSRVDETGELEHYPKAAEFAEYPGSRFRVKDLVGPPDVASLYTIPNTVVVYVEGSEAELLALGADPEHVELWMGLIDG